MSSPLPTLLYFGFRGRGLASRVALFNTLGKEGWVDKKISLPRWKKAERPASLGTERIHAEYITNNLPQLNLPCGLKVSQSQVIAKWAATQKPDQLPPHHLTDLYPEDSKQALLVDEASLIVEQILLQTPKDTDEVVKAENRKKFYESGFLRVGMEILEGRIKESGGPFLLGDKLTLADLYIRSPLCDLFDLKQFDGVPEEFIDEFPRVRDCGKAVLEHPLLKAYVDAGYK